MKNEEWRHLSNQAHELDNSWFNLHITPKFYLFTQPKIASSWSYEQFGDFYRFQIELQTLKISSKSEDDWIKTAITLERQKKGIKDAEKKKLIQFYRDWNNLVDGKSSKKEFIFLIRNPIDKKIAGFIQDVLLYSLNHRSFNSPFLIKHWLESGFTRDEIYEYKSECDRKNHFPGFAGKNNEFVPLLRKAIRPVVDNWFDSTIIFINEVNDDHKHTNYFLHHKLFASRNNKIDKSKIRLIDIDRQNIGLTFQHQFGMKMDADKFHEREAVLKNLVYEAFLPHMNQLMSQIKHECLIYCDLINYIYPAEMYENKNNPSYVYTAPEFVERYNLRPHYKDSVTGGIEVSTLLEWFVARAEEMNKDEKEASDKANKALFG